jgi:hypothetical protein
MGVPRENLISHSYTKHFLKQTPRKEVIRIYYIVIQIFNLLNNTNSNAQVIKNNNNKMQINVKHANKNAM